MNISDHDDLACNKVYFRGGWKNANECAAIAVEEYEQKQALLDAAKLVAPACDSLMAEACGHGVTKWGPVNDMLCAIRAAIEKAEAK